MLHDERQVVLHQGVYKKTATVGEAVFMITGMTIGAGILGLPYAVSRAGLLPGVFLIFVLGIIMFSINLMIGRVATLAGDNLQLPGLAGKYLGGWAKGVLSITVIFSSYGVLLAYLVGEGAALSALFGGSALGWSVVFWSAGSFLIWLGLQRIRYVEKFFSLAVIIIIAVLSAGLLPYFRPAAFTEVHWPSFFFPMGVILFALHATPAIAEARALLPGRPAAFRRALVIGTIIPIAVYILFTVAVVGLSGLSTTPVATVGIGQAFSPIFLILANIFAVLAMSTGFMGLGTALKETLMWDYRVPSGAAQFLVISVPLALFLLGARHFVGILNVVGGLFIAVESIIMILTYFRATGQEKRTWFLLLPLLAFFSILAIFSLYGALEK
ncbi:MAG: Permease for amino acids and related compound [Parcubacteria group bacterium GW2011_GWA2_53_21]|nr:MAG: Permease for amino acids and related compound [Parcubacteria group bacterium GW2011_GWA2_53_21]